MKEYLKKLPPSHKDYPHMNEALKTFHDINNYNNDLMKKLEEEQKKRAEEEKLRQQEAAASQSAQQLQEQQVRSVLNQQTEAQFRAYAQSQFPADPVQVGSMQYHLTI